MRGHCPAQPAGHDTTYDNRGTFEVCTYVTRAVKTNYSVREGLQHAATVRKFTRRANTKYTLKSAGCTKNAKWRRNRGELSAHLRVKWAVNNINRAAGEEPSRMDFHF
ncbi:hypothetical protein PUN28_001530 [Cardiocondyla obscurior]|uniref:Transposase DDE domain-containing protein n=1 Tax=Cardiocondyla obscurior TaxID=286306 RepID=A0AAW2H5G4_9HYME